MNKDLLTLRDITREDWENIYDLACKLKKDRPFLNNNVLAGKSIGQYLHLCI